MGYTILKFFAGAALIQLLFFSVFILTRKTENPIPNRILVSLLITKVLCLADSLLFFFKAWKFWVYLAHILYVGMSFRILLGAFLFLYTKSVIHRKFNFKWQDSFHIIPFLIYIGFMWIKYLRFDLTTKLRLLEHNGPYSSIVEYSIINSFPQIVISIYLILSIKELMHYRVEIKNNMSSIENQNLSWLSTVLFGFLAQRIFEIANISMIIITGSQVVLFMICSVAMILVFIQILVFKNLQQPQIIFGLEEKKKYKDSPLTEDMKLQYLEKLEKVMIEQKPFLDPMLTLPALAHAVKIQPRYLSQILNENLQQNFFDYVNRYRIEESKRLLSSNSNQCKTVLEVMLEVGFNSKATFNSAFKRYTGMTPTNFIQSN